MEGYDEWLEAPAHWTGKYAINREYLLAYMEISEENTENVEYYFDILVTTTKKTFVSMLTDKEVLDIVEYCGCINEVENDEDLNTSDD